MCGVHACVCVWTGVWEKSEVDVGNLPQSLSTVFSQSGSQVNPELSSTASLASLLQELLSPPSMASTLAPEPFPALQTFGSLSCYLRVVHPHPRF